MIDHERNAPSAMRRAFTRETVTNFATNAFLNGLCAWLLFNASVGAPTDFWNVLIDLSITCFCVCMITTFFCAAAARRLVRTGVIAPKTPDGSVVADLPRRTYMLGACLAGLATCPSVLVIGLGFTLIGVTALPPLAFVVYKAVFGGVLGAIVCRVVLMRLSYVDAIPLSDEINTAGADAPHDVAPSSPDYTEREVAQ